MFTACSMDGTACTRSEGKVGLSLSHAALNAVCFASWERSFGSIAFDIRSAFVSEVRGLLLQTYRP